MHTRVLILLLIATALAFSCSTEAEEERPVGANVIWILGDGLRYDAGTKMEVFRKFSKQATVYEGATATASDCIPSIASLFTGFLPSEHGAHVSRSRRNGAWSYHQDALQPTHDTLAESFGRLGYDTALASGNLLLADLDLGLAQGFDELLLSNGPATSLNTRIESWLETRSDKPFFLVINYADTRLGYAPAPGKPDPEPDSAEDTHRIARDLDPAILSGLEYFTSELDLLKARYADGVASLDFGIAELIRSLKSRGLFEEALVVISADHGESLGEHNLIRSGRGAFEELLHVPLAIKLPGQTTAARTRDRFSLLHVPRTILTGAFPKEFDELKDQFTRHEGHTDATAEQWYSHPSDFGHRWSDRFDQVLRIHSRGRWKLIDSDEGTDQLYDLGADKLELENQAQKHPGVAADMAMRIKDVFGEL